MEVSGGSNDIETDSDLDSEDDMDGILDGDLDRRDNETTAQHRKRMAKLLRERAAERKEARQREGRAGRKSKDAKDNKGVSQKKK